MRARKALVRYRDRTDPVPCPHGEVVRVVTGGTGGVANVHVVSVSRGGRHYHEAYDETYYVLAGTGTLRMEGVDHPLRPGAVAVIPAGVAHELEAAPGTVLEFVIFGTPPVPIEDAAARPRKVDP